MLVLSPLGQTNRASALLSGTLFTCVLIPARASLPWTLVFKTNIGTVKNNDGREERARFFLFFSFFLAESNVSRSAIKVAEKATQRGDFPQCSFWFYSFMYFCLFVNLLLNC